MRTRSITLFSLACAGLMFSSVAIGQQSAPKQMVYPAKGQTPQQQADDESQCNSWAVQQSGYNPANPPVAATAQPAPVTGSGARVRGAAAGATVGAIGGNNVGNAAAKGAVAGGVVRRNQNRGAAAAQNEAAAQQQQAGAAAYSNARQACLEGRGYSVK
jgi:hypothetical protein